MTHGSNLKLKHAKHKWKNPNWITQEELADPDCIVLLQRKRKVFDQIFSKRDKNFERIFA